MRHHRLWATTATIAIIGTGLILGTASLGRAGTSTAAFTLVAVPAQLTTSTDGLAITKFTPDVSGGSATHVVETITLPAGLTFDSTQSSSDCASGNGQTVICTVGTVQPGVTNKQFVAFTTPATAGSGGDPYQVTASVVFDNGTNSGPGGTNSPQIAQGSPQTVTVFPSGSAKAAGICTNIGYAVKTQAADSTNTQSTGLSFGPAASLLPCTWASVGVDPRIPLNTQISFVSGPQFAQLAALTISFYKLSVPLSKFTLLEYPNYPDLSGAFAVPACPTPTSLPPNADSCLLGYSKSGTITNANLLFAGTGGDPGYAG